MKKYLSRSQITGGQYVYPSTLKLRFTDHFLNRFEERREEFSVVPKRIIIGKHNIYSGEINSKSRIIRLVLRIEYTSSKWMFLCVDTRSGAVVTFWLRNKNESRICKQEINQDN